MNQVRDKCPQCDGKGEVIEYDMIGPFGMETCGRCNGDGKFHELKSTINVGYTTYDA